jgi:hypothetical protein
LQSISSGIELISAPAHPFKPARDQGQYVVLDEVVKVDDPGVRLELAGVLELVTNEPREGCSITRLGPDGDAVHGSVVVVVGPVALGVVAGEPGSWGLISMWGRNHAAPMPPSRSVALRAGRTSS